MKIEEVFRTIDQLKADGVIDRYALGGAVAATFYLEPVSTLDVDIFIELHASPEASLVSLDPIFAYLRQHGCSMEGEYILISGWPVQFLPTGSPLVSEALHTAIEMDVKGSPVNVFSAEHLAAIALQTGRAKDKARLLQFVEAGILDSTRFETILQRHGLMEKWRQFEKTFLA